MNKKINNIALVLACGLSVPVVADTGFKNGWYAGIGAGISHLEPDTNTTGFSVDDDSSSGFKLYLGYDWDEKWGIEGYVVDPGEASLAPTGTVEYTDFGVSGLYHFFNNRGEAARDSRTHLSLFGKVGLGFMKNSSDVPYDRLNDAHILLGAGLEYGFSNGFAVRAEAELFDKDSQFYSLSILKRFGKSAKKAAPVVAAVPAVVPKPVATTAPAPVPVVVVDQDSDGDGVMDSVDLCLDSKPGARVGVRGCKIADVIVLEGVQFKTSSANLKSVSIDVLNEAAATLNRYPDMKVEVAGHTDSRGAASFNQHLSEKRAQSVRDYLISKGVSAGRLSAKGYGSAQPIADNATREGRATNRRVELHIQK